MFKMLWNALLNINHNGNIFFQMSKYCQCFPMVVLTFHLSKRTLFFPCNFNTLVAESVMCFYLPYLDIGREIQMKIWTKQCRSL